MRWLRDAEAIACGWKAELGFDSMSVRLPLSYKEALFSPVLSSLLSMEKSYMVTKMEASIISGNSSEIPLEDSLWLGPGHMSVTG